MHNVLKLITQEEPRACGNLDAMVSSRSNEPRNQFENSIFDFADPSKLRRSLLEGNKDHLPSQARCELLKQEHRVGSTVVSMSFSNKLTLKDWNYGTPIMDILNLEENKLDYKKNYLPHATFSHEQSLHRSHTQHR